MPRAGVAPLACAFANGLAAVVLLVVLAPATPLVADPAERARYVADHLLLWRLGWGTWMIAALTLVWFYVWWRAKTGAPHAALAVAAAGLVVDLSAETALVVAAPDAFLAVAPLAYVLTGAVANGLYTVAGIVLTLATPLSAVERAWAALMWAGGLLLSAGAALDLPIVTAIATGVLFPLLVPWCVRLWLRLR